MKPGAEKGSGTRDWNTLSHAIHTGVWLGPVTGPGGTAPGKDMGPEAGKGPGTGVPSGKLTK